MVIGYHLIWTVYGWWLPNDPRGSSSHEIRVERIADLGELHFGRKPVQPLSAELRRFYEQARALLRHESLIFNDDQIVQVGAALAQVVRDRDYTCYACAIMPEHVHMLIRRHRDKSETMIEEFQSASRQAMLKSGDWPAGHPVWGGPGWKVFLNTSDDMYRITRCVGNNPLKAGRPAQSWEFVQEYKGWAPPFRR
jgi:REP element-mobilizing transposase RayT